MQAQGLESGDGVLTLWAVSGGRDHGGYATYASGKLQHWVSTYKEDFLETWPESSQAWNALTDENYA